MIKINPTTAMFPGASHIVSTARASMVTNQFQDTNFDLNSIQLCPQTCVSLTEELAIELAERFTNTKFFLHANIKLNSLFEVFDASVDLKSPKIKSYAKKLKTIIHALGGNGYSWHAASARGNVISFEKACENTKRLQDMLGVDVSIEGLYPSQYEWPVASVDDYEKLLNADVNFALDVSHLYICNCQDRVVEMALIEELVKSTRCAEVHLSKNDGKRDMHAKFESGEDLPFGWNAIQVAYADRVNKPLVFLESNFGAK